MKLLRDQSFFMYKDKKYNFDANDLYGNVTDEDILSDVSGKDIATFVYEEGYAIFKK